VSCLSICLFAVDVFVLFCFVLFYFALAFGFYVPVILIGITVPLISIQAKHSLIDCL